MITISAAQAEIRAPAMSSIEGLENPSASSGRCCAADQINTISGQISTLEVVYSRFVFPSALANGVKTFGMWVPTTDPSGSGLIADARFKGQGAGMRILYGGSVKPSNAKELMAVPNVNGGLIGGASLKASDFLAIAQGCG